MSATTHPEVLWAQRSSTSSPEKNVIYLTVNLPDITESTLEYTLQPTGLSFKARCKNVDKDFAFDLAFFAEIDPEKSSHRLTSRSLVATLYKKELQSEFWPRLTKDKLKTPFIKTNFEKWVDEDEQDGNPNLDDDPVGGIPGMDDMGMGMGGMGGMGGMDFSKIMAQAQAAGGSTSHEAGIDEEDSDNDGPPPLEDAELSK